MSTDTYDSALNQLREYGLEVKRLETTGKIVRCKYQRDKPGSKNGWYVAHDFVSSSGRRLTVGSFGWWKDADGSQKITIQVNGSPITEDDSREIEVRQKQINEEVERDRALAAEAAATKAEEYWNQAKTEGEHPYLRRKGVKNYGLRFDGDMILVPILRSGSIVGIQSIKEDGTKRFSTGMSTKGGHFILGTPEPQGVVAIVEGYATGATVHELTGWPVVVAFNAGNLAPVALELKTAHPDARFIFCADDDSQTDGNPGLTYARKAAAEVGWIVTAPKFSGKKDRGTDWNDLATMEGPSEAAKQLLASVPMSRVEILDAFSKCAKKTDAQRLLLGNVGAQLKAMADNQWEEVKLDIIDGGLLNDRDLNRLRKGGDLDAVKGWKKKLETSGNGKILAQRGNLLVILGNDPMLSKAFALDTFTQKIRVMRKLPGMPAEVPEEGIALGKDIKSTIAVYLSQHYCDFRSDYITDVIIALAQLNAYNPLKQKLDACAESWDGVKRIDTWLPDMCGAENNLFTRTVGRLWLIQAVARVYQPGCKADCMLVIDGCQGAGKSSFFEALSYSYFSDRIEEIGSKDGVGCLRGKWIVEFSELDALRGRKAETIKAYLSRSTDNTRLAYQEDFCEYKRTCVFVGTTNEDRYLTDLTGNRRFWPVKCHKLDVEKARKLRDQLWGEAVRAYHSREKWWISEDDPIAEHFREQQEKRLAIDDRITLIQEYLKTEEGPVKPINIWIDALRGNPHQYGKPEQAIVGGLMKKLGWVSTQERIDGVRMRVWRRGDI